MIKLYKLSVKIGGGALNASDAWKENSREIVEQSRADQSIAELASWKDREKEQCTIELYNMFHTGVPES